MKHAALAVMMIACAIAAWGRGVPEAAADEGAAKTVNETRAADAKGLVDIRTIAGSVTLRGWDRAEVKVTGSLEADVKALDIGHEGATTTIEVRGPEPGEKARNVKLGSTLEISVPAGASVRVSTLGASIDVVDVGGVRELQTVGGTIRVKGGSGPVLASTLGGAITVEAPSARVRFSTAGGAVTITGADGEIAGRTMSGSIGIAGSRIVDADLSTMNGDITIDAEIAEDGRLKAVTELGGRIDLTVPAGVEGRFSLSCRADVLDMSAFKPTGKLAWVFREQAGVGTMALTVTGLLPGRAGEGAADAFRGAEVRVDAPGRISMSEFLVELPGGRLSLGTALNEFTVGTNGARIYLETSPMSRGNAEGPSIVLKTR